MHFSPLYSEKRSSVAFIAANMGWCACVVCVCARVCGLQEEMDPYEKLLSPCRKTRRSARLNSQTKDIKKDDEAKEGSEEKKEGKKSE